MAPCLLALRFPTGRFCVLDHSIQSAQGTWERVGGNVHAHPKLPTISNAAVRVRIGVFQRRSRLLHERMGISGIWLEACFGNVNWRSFRDSFLFGRSVLTARIAALTGSRPGGLSPFEVVSLGSAVGKVWERLLRRILSVLPLGLIASRRRGDVKLLADLPQPYIGYSIFFRCKAAQRGFPNLFVEGFSADFHERE